MEFHPIKLEDKQKYEKYYRAVYRMASDASFTTSYAWAESFYTKICIEDDVLCLQGKNKEGIPYFMMPVGTGDKEKFLRKLYIHCQERSIPFSLHWLLKEDVSFINNIFHDTIEIQESRNSAEYIYKTESLLSLSGKKLHSKRNHVNAFKSAYKYNTEPITQENISISRDFVIAHCNTSEEKNAMERLFASYFLLNLTGMLLYVGETLVAVTAGEQICNDTALIHLEKADTKFTGSYPAVNQLFIENYFSHTKYINREEDMGIEGLRKAKLSYRPVFLLEKFTALEKK